MTILAETDWGAPLLICFFGCLVVVWLYALISCLRRQDFSKSERIAWVIVILFTNYLGLIAYFIFGGRKPDRTTGRFPKAIDPLTGEPNVTRRL
jgi:hypothetical protein